MTFDEFVRVGTGHLPYQYQRRLADEGLPDVLNVPTGGGKTLAATLPWLWRRREHPDPDVRAATPRWLVLTLPMRVLVEQTYEKVGEWLRNLELADDVGLYRVLGGEGRSEARWRYEPDHDAVFVGTQDMLLSRALNRGYGESRWAWPIDFGLLSSDTLWVFDEVQLMGPGLPTSRQLDGLRRNLGVAVGCQSMWMSATVDRDRLSTIDNPELGRVDELPEQDRVGPLRQRLEARKVVRRLDVSHGPHHARDLAAAVVERHMSGHRTIVMLNTVDRAVDLYGELQKQGAVAECVLVHSRFRPADRERIVKRALAEPDEDGPGSIVVSTQVLEAGVDISATTLIVEAAPWPSIVQRAGRCNRYGEVDDASVWWLPPPRHWPYDEAEVEAAQHALADLDGRSASPAVLERTDVPAKDPLHPVLRRRDLLELFDTLPDLSGNDIDVSRFIRGADDTDVQVAWDTLNGDPPDSARPLPSREERCPVPLRDLRDRSARINERHIWRYDHLAERWTRCMANDLRAGQVLIMDSAEGGYDSVIGWSLRSGSPVPPIWTDADSPDDDSTDPVATNQRVTTGSDVDARAGQAREADSAPIADDDTGLGADPLSFPGHRAATTKPWVSLRRHSDDVEAEVRRLLASLKPDLPTEVVNAAILAGRYHDLGKAHPVFQATLRNSADEAKGELIVAEREQQPWAKSGGTARSHHERPYFRHELASALMLLAHESLLLRGVEERDLVLYLVAAHHGKVRLGFRSLPGEKEPEESDRLFALGVWQDDDVPLVELTGQHVPDSELDLSVMQLGRAHDGTPSWAERALALRDSDDLGPFRLGFLEAVVRVADCQVSRRYELSDTSPAGGR